MFLIIEVDRNGASLLLPSEEISFFEVATEEIVLRMSFDLLLSDKKLEQYSESAFQIESASQMVLFDFDRLTF